MADIDEFIPFSLISPHSNKLCVSFSSLLKDIRMAAANILFALIVLLMKMAESVFVSDHVKLEADYSKETLPPTEDEAPLLLRASVNLRNILEVIETKQQISLEVTLRYYWRDTRIIPVQKYLNGKDSFGSYINLHPGMRDNFWMPDTFIDQAINLRKPTYFLEPSSLR